MRDVGGAGAEVGGQLGDLARVRLRLGGAVHRLLEARGGDQLHRPRDLADVADRLAAFDEGAGLGHGYSVLLYQTRPMDGRVVFEREHVVPERPLQHDLVALLDLEL